MSRKKKKNNPFLHTDYESLPFRNSPKFNIDDMYQTVVAELGLQQSKRDQLITIYLAAFAFIVPPMLTKESTDWLVNGFLFLLLGLLGILFALVIIRYRKYKEVYWLCARTLNVMMDIDEENWSKETIQSVFYGCMRKKTNRFLDEKTGKLQTISFVWSNLFSSESLYLTIHALITSCVAGAGAGLLLPYSLCTRCVGGIGMGILVFLYLLFMYFKTLKSVYAVCEDKQDDSFNRTFGDAWFLHFFIDRKQTEQQSDKPIS